jgi:hypothetical protein
LEIFALTTGAQNKSGRDALAQSVGNVPLASLVATCLASAGLCAEAGKNAPQIDAFAAQPGAEVTTRKEGDREVLEVRRNGVRLIQVRRGDKIEVYGVDVSGHGAVLCTWEIFIGVSEGLEACFPGQDPELRQDMKNAIAAINDFIVANSLMPTTITEVEARVSVRRQAAASRVSEDKSGNECRGGALGQLINALRKMPRELRLRAVSDLLSVPRPPVTNPC